MNIENLKKIIHFNSKGPRTENFNEIIDSIYENLEELISKNSILLTQLHENNSLYLSTISSFKKEEIINLCIIHNYKWPTLLKFKKGEEALEEKWKKFIGYNKSNQIAIVNAGIEENINFIKNNANSTDKSVRAELYKAKNFIVDNINILTTTQITELIGADSKVFEFVKNKSLLVSIFSKLSPMPVIIFKHQDSFLAEEYFSTLLSKKDLGNQETIKKYLQSPNRDRILYAFTEKSSIESLKTLFCHSEQSHFIFSKHYPESALKELFQDKEVIAVLQKSDINHLVNQYAHTLPEFIFPLISSQLNDLLREKLLFTNPHYFSILKEENQEFLNRILQNTYCYSTDSATQINNAQQYIIREIENISKKNSKSHFNDCIDIALSNKVKNRQFLLIKEEDFISHICTFEKDADYFFNNSSTFYQHFFDSLKPHMKKLNKEQVDHLINVSLYHTEEVWAKSFLSTVDYSKIEALLSNDPDFSFTSKQKEFLLLLKERNILDNGMQSTNKIGKTPKL